MSDHYQKCLEIENDSFHRLHKDNINYQDAQQLRMKNYQAEIEILQRKLKELENVIKLLEGEDDEKKEV
jgi:hypothetical protein